MVNEAVFEHIKVRYLFLWLIVFFILAVFLYAGTTNLVAEAEVDVVVSFLFYGLISLWIIRNFHRVKMNNEKFFGHLPLNYNWLYLFIIIFGVIILSLGLGELSRYILSTIDPNILNELPSTSFFYNQSETPFAPILNYIEFIVAVIIAPIVEEILFRGVMLHRFTIKWGVKWAILASSIIFALFHADIIGAFIFAIVMCILYIKTASILVPIVAHIINNLLAYGFEIMLSFSPGSTVASHSLEVAVLLLTVSIMIILYFLYRNWPQRYWRPPYFQEVYDGIPENLYYD
jgi:membrane protease YdiL (CAAX protease family)